MGYAQTFTETWSWKAAECFADKGVGPMDMCMVYSHFLSQTAFYTDMGPVRTFTYAWSYDITTYRLQDCPESCSLRRFRRALIAAWNLIFCSLVIFETSTSGPYTVFLPLSDSTNFPRSEP